MPDSKPEAKEPDGPPITWETSRMVTDLIVACARNLKLLPLEQLGAFLDKADTLGWFMDPTGYREHHVSLTAAQLLVRAARTFLERVETILKEMQR